MTKNLLLPCLLLFYCIATYAQNPEKAEILIRAGIDLHDKGDYDGAIAKYEEALKADKDNPLALAEKALSLTGKKEYKSAMLICQSLIERGIEGDYMRPVYLAYGNALDLTGKPKEAIIIYDRGLKFFPKDNQLYYNKGVTLLNLENYEEALAAFEKAALMDPAHASSHNVIGRLNANNNKISALMALGVFMVIEPEGKRAEANLPVIQKLLAGNATKNGKQNIIYLDGSAFSDTTKSMDNNFRMTELMLSLSASLNLEKKYLKMNDAEKLSYRFGTICSSLKTTKEKDTVSGFYWKYYAPFFIEMNDKKHLETFSYLVYASSGERYVKKWIKANPDKIREFYSWVRGYKWPENV